MKVLLKPTGGEDPLHLCPASQTVFVCFPLEGKSVAIKRKEVLTTEEIKNWQTKSEG